MQNIRFFTEDIHFKLQHKTKITNWIKNVVSQNNRQTNSINYIFTSDDNLLEINKKYLNHNTFTDIITFNNSPDDKIIEADIFISIDRVKENAKELQIDFETELHRVMIHGILHLLGFNDKSTEEEAEMRKKENHYLALRF